MRFKVTLFSLSMTVLAGCGSTISSETLSGSQIEAIAANIERLHPTIDSNLKQQVLEVAVNAVDNMVFVEGGEFMMGDFGWACDPGSAQICNIDGDSDNYPVHNVRLDSYHLARYETTVHEFDQFRLAHGKEIYFADRRDDLKILGPNHPSFTKDWQEVKDYCQWLGQVTALPVDLPTEAQWEYAARNRGQKILFATDSGEIDRGRNFEPMGNRSILPVGSFPPNPLGIQDLSGNMSEWVDDWFSETYYAESPESNPTGPKTGTQKILRGANNRESLSPIVMRHAEPPTLDRYTTAWGFRCGIRQGRPL
ncbi:MAG: sulfatase modifying factor 1 [Motiliproteus sp.]|jgi:sulfatase modifying factor 1